ncbi:Lovastatin diketide synthase LovF [Cercospora beticola]|uniref:Lovastatin diketide synthase LovF n=1 Tax=Cercospora beticola TaxID=122368 RepID=A0A2G5I2Q1_CERBT|nr:Lovastatin diketide synthase LovF [Cercospora beticola]PIA98773.1 Lovastatin diketide synthase LovF [Cercospora beticola]WPB00411.1 hypothetical protein RHO25_005030 [Cercospora beticola]CAK1361377.1 unnamed protein product [Cercospora beticola]
MAPKWSTNEALRVSPKAQTSSPQPLQHAGPEAIAIIGMGCRFPGDSNTPDEFWNMLLEKRNGFSRPPPSRFNIEGFHSKKKRPGSIRPEGACFVSDTIYDFDSPFFGITKSEAEAMDPQQRKLLETVYEALEQGGITLERVSGSKTGVYVGNFNYDYGVQNLRDADYPRDYSMTGQGVTILANRISYVFNLTGPSVTLDTACSSSMYATHMACRALSSGEIDGAIIGGTNLIQSIENHMSTDAMGVLSPTSHSHTFDSSADGYGRGEGVGAIYVKRLSDALRDGDPIRGLIRGTAVNSCGKTSGITQPSATSQSAVIRDAYGFAKISDLDETGYFETHGTGTSVGDPIELHGIADVFASSTGQRRRHPLLLGGVKPNTGHAEAASAIASILKAAYILEKGTIPATIGIKKLNGQLDFRGGELEVVQENRHWPTEHEIRRASVNSFGYGGANGHAIVEAVSSVLPGYQSFKTRETSRQNVTTAKITGTMGSGESTFFTKERTQFLLPFSAHDLDTLRANIAATRDVADQYDTEDLAYTLAARRSRFSHRGYAVVNKTSTAHDLEEQAISIGKRGHGANIVFVFNGQGGQSVQMGKDLMQDFPSYLQSIRELDKVLQSLGKHAPPWSLETELLKAETASRVQEAQLSQPLCTAVQIALVDLLDTWDVRAKATVGHSSGEIAAAYAAGTISRSEAIIFAYFRGVAVVDGNDKGQMIAVGLSAEECEPYLEDGVVIACYNSPISVTLSGGADAISHVQAKLERDNIFTRAINTGGRAYHSHHMGEPAISYLDNLQHALKLNDSIAQRSGKLARDAVFSSSVYGTVMETGFRPGPEYWTKNLKSPVLFSQALHALLSSTKLKLDTIIEIGPHCTLASPIRQLRDKLDRKHEELAYFASLVRGHNSTLKMLDLAGALFIKGHDISLAAVNSIERMVDGTLKRTAGKTLVDLPPYKWNYENGRNLRLKNRFTEEYRLRKFPRHDLLGSRITGGIRDRPQWRNLLDLKGLSWLEQHKLSVQPVFPAMGYIAIAVEAARQFFSEFLIFRNRFRYVFPQITIKAALNLPTAGTHVEVLTSMQFQQISDSTASKETAVFSIQSCSNGIWTEHATGKVKIERGDPMQPLFEEAKLQEPKTAHTWYRGFSNVDLNYGAAFSGLSDIRSDPWENEVTALTKLLPAGVDQDDSRYLVHPATMDTCIQAALIAAHHGSLKDLRHSFIPVSMDNLVVWNYDGRDIPALQPADGRVLAVGSKSGERKLVGTMQLFDPEGRPLFAIDRINCVKYADKLISNTQPDSHPHLRVVWKPDVDHPNAFATPIRVPQALLRMWAESLVSTARTRLTHPIAKAVLEALPGNYASQAVEEPSLDFGSEGMGEEIFELESLVLNTFRHLGKDYRPPSEGVMPETFQKALDLVTHKRSNLDILLLVDGNNTDIFRTLESTLKSKSSLKRYRTLDIVVTNGQANSTLVRSLADFRQVLFTESNIFAFPDEMATAYDLIVIAQPPSYLQKPVILNEFLNDMKRHLKERGRLLIAEGRHDLDADTGHILDTIASGLGESFSSQPFDNWSEAIKKQDFDVRFADSQPTGWTLLTAEVSSQQRTADLILLSRQEDCNVTEVFHKGLKKAGFQVSRASLASHDFVAKDNATYVSIVEFGDSLFDTLDPVEFGNLQAIANKAGTVVWTTTGNLLGEANARAAAILGLARTLQNENLALQFYTIDLDHKNAKLGACQVAYLLHSIDAEDAAGDNEFVVKNGAYYVSRLSEDVTLDAEVQKKTSNKLTKKSVTSESPVRLAIERVGAFDTLHFVADDRDSSLKIGQVEVAVKSVGLSMKDVAKFQGDPDFESHCYEGAGIIRRVAPGVTKVAVGDCVTWIGKGAFANVERFDAIHVHKLSHTDKLEVVAAMPLAFSTAIYGLLHRGRLRWRERVLIHSATDGVGLAAIQVAKMVGAEIFATVATEKQKAFLMKHYGLDNAHVFSSADTGFAHEIMDTTKAYGIDVCLSSLEGELLHASWGLMAVDGRYVNFGSHDSLDHGSLDFEVFKRSATFTAFDLGALAEERPHVLAGVMQEVLQYFREGKIKPLHPTYTCSAGDIDVAFQQVSHGDNIGKLVVSFDGQPLKVKENAEGVKFRSDGTYLLVGCLGGLGRCLSRWMVEKGARNLTFLGRSGASSKAAAQFVCQLQARGVTVNVIKGDVSSKADVERAVANAAVPVLGVVQGAMALQDFRFDKLNLDQWNAAIRPKIHGTLNLHEALFGQPLEFFIMLSSIAGMTGNATQSNYCTGNTFMDFFARHRRQQGLPATTIALTMVQEIGFVSQDEKIEQGLAHTGLVAINEKEFIDLMETAMLPQPKPTWTGDDNATALLISGLDPAKISPDVLTSGNRFWHQPRLGPLTVALEEKLAESSDGNDKQAAPGHDLPSLLEAVQRYLAKTFGISADDVDELKPLIDFGMDSMIGIALRNWVFATYDVKIPTSDIMGTTLSARTLAEQIHDGLQAS